MTRKALRATPGVLALAVALVAGPAAAASASAGDPGAWVRLQDQRVLELRAPLGDVSPEQRARDATAALRGALAAPGALPETHVEPGGAVVRVGGTAVLRLGPADAAAEGIALEDLASRAAAQLRVAIEAERRRRAAHDLVYRWSMVVFSGLVALLLARWLGRTAVSTAERLEAAGAPAAGLRLAGVEVLSGPAVRGAAAIGLRLGRFLAQGAVLLAWALAALARFEPTRGSGEQLVRALLGPTAALGAQLVGAIPVVIAGAVAVVALGIVVRGAGVFFDAVGRGDAAVRWLPRHLARPVGALVRAGLVLAAVLLGASAAGGEGLLAGLGRAAVLALGLAAAPVVACALAGLPLAFGRSIRPGDRVRLSGQEGRVVEIGLLVVVLEDERGGVVRVPHLVSLFAAVRVDARGAPPDAGRSPGDGP